MKYFLAIIGAAALALTANAALPDAINVFGTGSTNAGTQQSWCIIGARSANAGTPVVTSIDAAGDTPNTLSVHLYRVTEQTQCTFTNSTVSIPVTTTNTGTKWDTQTIIIRHMQYDTYEKRILTTSGGETNLQVTVAPLTAVTPRDIIYKVIDDPSMGYVSMETNTVAANRMFVRRANPTGICVGQKGLPLMLEVTTTNSSSAFLNNAAGYYAP